MIIFLRHGQAKNNVERILAGRTEGFPLTELGIKQAKNTATFLDSLQVSAIYSSPIERALETAKIVANRLDLDYKIDSRLTEIEMGKFSGMPYEEMFAKYGNIFLKFYQENSAIGKNGIETFSSVKKRVLDMVSLCAKNHAEENVLLVTHMDPIKAMISTILQLKPQSLYELVIRNASLTMAKKEQNNYSLLAVNSMNAERYTQE